MNNLFTLYPVTFFLLVLRVACKLIELLPALTQWRLCVCVVIASPWRELPQVSFFVATNTRLSQQERVVCRGKTRLLLRQMYACIKV